MSQDQRDVRNEGEQGDTQGRSLGASLRLWGSLGAGALLVIFLLQNLQKAEINFLWMSYNIRTIYALLIAAALGAIVALSIGYLRGRARNRRERAAVRRTS